MKRPAPGGEPGRAEDFVDQPKSTALKPKNPASIPIYALNLEPLPDIDVFATEVSVIVRDLDVKVAVL